MGSKNPSWWYRIEWCDICGFSGLIRGADGTELSLAVVNRDSPEALRGLLEEIFDGQSITVDEIERDGAGRDMVYLLDSTEVIARTPLDEGVDAVLLVNSDLYATGSRDGGDVELPAVIGDDIM